MDRSTLTPLSSIGFKPWCDRGVWGGKYTAKKKGEEEKKPGGSLGGSTARMIVGRVHLGVVMAPVAWRGAKTKQRASDGQ